MAERRMFSKTIVFSDAFIDMPFSARGLYHALCMVADDDGFVNSPKSIVRQIEASGDDLDLLVEKKFILNFDSGVIVIKHWKIHNYIQKDRYKETKYLKEKASLMLDEKGAYTRCIQDVYKMDTQVSIGKSIDSLGQYSGSVGEDTDTATTADRSTQLKLIGGSLGKNVVYLTDEQLEKLLDKMGMDAFNRYVGRLADYIIEKNAHIKCHYSTILKWYEEDTGA